MIHEEQIQRLLWPGERFTRGTELYALLDGARDGRIHQMVERSGLEWQCLYAGTLPLDLLEVAPYLVRMQPDTRFMHDLITAGWGNAWGIWIVSSAPFNELRRHLRRFLRVRDESGRRLLFRYYDPLVFAAFLPTCTATELAALFGPIDAFLIEAASRAGITEFSFDGVQLNAGSGTYHVHVVRTAENSSARAVSGSMLVIRAPQLDALRDSLARTFEDELAADLARFWPDTCATLGPPALRARVALGVARARAHGLDARGDIARYLNTMAALGPDFDADSRYPWAAAILGAPLTGKVKMDKICARASEALGGADA